MKSRIMASYTRKNSVLLELFEAILMKLHQQNYLSTWVFHCLIFSWSFGLRFFFLSPVTFMLQLHENCVIYSEHQKFKNSFTKYLQLSSLPATYTDSFLPSQTHFLCRVFLCGVLTSLWAVDRLCLHSSYLLKHSSPPWPNSPLRFITTWDLICTFAKLSFSTFNLFLCHWLAFSYRKRKLVFYWYLLLTIFSRINGN